MRVDSFVRSFPYGWCIIGKHWFPSRTTVHPHHFLEFFLQAEIACHSYWNFNSRRHQIVLRDVLGGGDSEKSESIKWTGKTNILRCFRYLQLEINVHTLNHSFVLGYRFQVRASNMICRKKICPLISSLLRHFFIFPLTQYLRPWKTLSIFSMPKFER